jgi:hypothetical protein
MQNKPKSMHPRVRGKRSCRRVKRRRDKSERMFQRSGMKQKRREEWLEIKQKPLQSAEKYAKCK